MQTVLSHTNQSFLGELTPSNQTGDWCSTCLFGFNGMEKDPEITGQEGSHYTAAFWEYDTRIGRRWNVDPVKIASESPYATFRNNPILFVDPNGDCPDCEDGTYTIQEGDNFWDLEESWGMEHGTLSAMNEGLDPTKLQIGQEIRVTLNESDLPDGVELNSEHTLEGMDQFFRPGQEGVNRIQEVSEEEFMALAEEKAWKYDNSLSYMRMGDDLKELENMYFQNGTGGILDMKKYMLNDIEQYTYDISNWFNKQNSVSEPATRTLYVYQGYAYNLNEFGNLLFGAAHAKRGTNLDVLKMIGNVYSRIQNKAGDAEHETRALERGYNYVKE